MKQSLCVRVKCLARAWAFPATRTSHVLAEWVASDPARGRPRTEHLGWAGGGGASWPKSTHSSAPQCPWGLLEDHPAKIQSPLPFSPHHPYSRSASHPRGGPEPGQGHWAAPSLQAGSAFGGQPTSECPAGTWVSLVSSWGESPREVCSSCPAAGCHQKSQQGEDKGWADPKAAAAWEHSLPKPPVLAPQDCPAPTGQRCSHTKVHWS